MQLALEWVAGDHPRGQAMAKKKDESTPQGADQGVDLSFHPVVTRLKGTGDSLPEVVKLEGYLGPSDKKDHVRLYFDLDFTSYVDVPKDAVLYREPDDPKDETRPTIILVSASAKLSYVAAQKFENVEASFLRGGIACCCPIQIPVCCHHTGYACHSKPPSGYGTRRHC